MLGSSDAETFPELRLQISEVLKGYSINCNFPMNSDHTAS
jgi:hypothetical protein